MFHSRGLQICKWIGTKECVYIKKRVQLPQDCFERPTWPTWLHVKRVYKLLNKFFLLEIQRHFKVSTEASTVPGVNPEAANEDQVSNSSFCKLHLQTNPRGDCWSRGVRNPRFVRNWLDLRGQNVFVLFSFLAFLISGIFSLAGGVIFLHIFFVLVKLLPPCRFMSFRTPSTRAE